MVKNSPAELAAGGDKTLQKAIEQLNWSLSLVYNSDFHQMVTAG